LKQTAVQGHINTTGSRHDSHSINNAGARDENGDEAARCRHAVALSRHLASSLKENLKCEAY